MPNDAIVQNSPTRGLTPISPDPIEGDLSAQTMIVDWANMSYSTRTDSFKFAAQLGIHELDLWHWVKRLSDKIRAVRAAKVEAEHGESIDRAMATKAAKGSAKHANVYYKYVEQRKDVEQQGTTAIQVNVGIPE